MTTRAAGARKAHYCEPFRKERGASVSGPGHTRHLLPTGDRGRGY